MNHCLPDKTRPAMQKRDVFSVHSSSWMLYQIDEKAISKVIKEHESESVSWNVKDGLRVRVEHVTSFGKTEKAEKMGSFLKILPSFEGHKRCRNQRLLNSFLELRVMERVSYFDMDGVHPRLEPVYIWKRGVKFLPRNFQTCKLFIINNLHNRDSFVFYTRCSTRLPFPVKTDLFLTTSITRSYQRLSATMPWRREWLYGSVFDNFSLFLSLNLRPMRSRLHVA